LHTSALAALLALAACVFGCGFAWPPPAVPDVATKEMFYKSQPLALLTFSANADGKIVGVEPGWRFPKVIPSQGIPGGLFTYVGDFKVMARGADGSPVSAVGKREVYFRETERISFSDPRSFQMGSHVATDRISMTFAFTDLASKVSVTLTAKQETAHPFTYQGETVTPPAELTETTMLGGEYSPDYNGFFLFTLDSGSMGEALQKGYQQELQDENRKALQHLR
jgi:hypothetical protein